MARAKPKRISNSIIKKDLPKENDYVFRETLWRMRSYCALHEISMKEFARRVDVAYSSVLHLNNCYGFFSTHDHDKMVVFLGMEIHRGKLYDPCPLSKRDIRDLEEFLAE